MANWIPQQKVLEEIYKLLSDSHVAISAVQQECQAKIEHYRTSLPDFNSYLCFIFTQFESGALETRQIAGLLLKNHIRTSWAQFSPQLQAFIKHAILACLAHPQRPLRNTAGTVVLTIAKTATLESWPDLLQHLWGMLNSNNLDQLLGVFDTLQKLTLEMPQALLSERLNNPLQHLVPAWIRFFSHSNSILVESSITCLRQYYTLMPQAVTLHMKEILENLFRLATSPSPGVRRAVCQSLVQLAYVRMEMLAAHIPQIIQYMLGAMKDADDSVALEATEFWTSISEYPDMCKTHLTPHLPALVMNLLDRMPFGPIELTFLRSLEGDDETVPDSDQDVRPIIVSGKVVGHALDDDDEEDEDIYESLQGDWTLRKSAASGIENLALVFQNDLLQPLLNQLPARFESAEWTIRESAILALGAVAKGCMDNLTPHLPNVLPWLINSLKDATSHIRVITCWTIGQYAPWIADQTRSNPQSLGPLLEALTGRMLDTKKRVQQAAVSSLSNIMERAGPSLVPWIQPILTNFMHAFGKYQTKSRILLFDAITVLAEAVGPELNRPEFINLLLPPLMEYLNRLTDDDRKLFPLLWCFTSVAQALGQGFVPFAQPLFARCIRLMQTTLQAYQVAKQQNEEDLPEKDFLVGALDLAAGIIEALGATCLPLLQQTSFLELVGMCCYYPEAPVRQSAFAVVGDLAINCYEYLTSKLGEIVPLLIQSLPAQHIELSSEQDRLANNAVWAIGEITMKSGAVMDHFAQAGLLDRLISIMTYDHHSRALRENAAITLGRLGYVAASMAPRLNEFVAPWLRSLRDLHEDQEKASAFMGLCAVTKKNPAVVFPFLTALLEAFASWEVVPQALAPEMYQLCVAFKQNLAGRWEGFYATVASRVRDRLHQKLNGFC